MPACTWVTSMSSRTRALEFARTQAFAAQQGLVQGGIELPVTLESRLIPQNLRQLHVADAVALILGIARQQRLADQAVQHGLLELGIVQGLGLHAGAQPVQRAAIFILADIHAVNLGDIDLAARVEIGVDTPERERDGDQRQDETGDNALGFFADLGKHAWLL